MTAPAFIDPLREALPVWGWYCEQCGVKWGIDAGTACWNCGRASRRNAVLPYASVAATVDEVVDDVDEVEPKRSVA